MNDILTTKEGVVANAIKAIEYAYDLGIRIINCSWDSSIYNQDLKNIMEKYSDILFICTAGKSGSNLNFVPVYPACYDLPNIVTVAAIDNQGNLFSFSGFGGKVDVAAPGVDIYGIRAEGGYDYSSGTSAAVAYVTGIASLVKSCYPQLNSIEIAKI